MTKLHKVTLWTACVLIAALAALWGTGSLGPLYRWMVRYFGPEVWSALGTWFTAAVAIATVLVAGRYAKQQVEKAQDQVDEARRTRELQAQPNVVLYSEPNPSVWQILEVVVKNFGTTPAYDIKISITPQLQSTPNHVTYPKIADIPVPRRLPILAPGQAWKTVWDSAPTRQDHLRQLNQKLGKAEIPLLEYYDQIPNRRHHAIVTYTDSERKKRYETEAELDFNMLDGTTQARINTIHDLTKEVESVQDALESIAETLKSYSKNEHKGIWVYVKDADDERTDRPNEADEIVKSMQALKARLQQAQNRARERAAAKDPGAPDSSLKEILTWFVAKGPYPRLVTPIRPG